MAVASESMSTAESHSVPYKHTMEEGFGGLIAELRKLNELQAQSLRSQNKLAEEVHALAARIDRLEAREAQPATSLASIRPSAGQRLTSITELLSMILAETTCEDLFFAQHVNKDFKTLIDHSPVLQRKLYFSSSQADDGNAEINPLVTKRSVLARLPFFFDHENHRMAYCARAGRQRIVCHSIKRMENTENGQTWLQIEFERVDPRQADTEFDTKWLTWPGDPRPPPKPIGPGSWRRMRLVHTDDVIKWCVSVKVDEKREQIYHGQTKNRGTMDDLLECMAAVDLDRSEVRRIQRR